MKREIKDFVESMESSVETGMEFDEVACCVLNRAFEKNPEVTKRLEDIVDDDEIFGSFRRMLEGSENIKFTPEDNMKTVRSQIAKRELERINSEDEDDKDLECGHSVDDHVSALEYIVEKMGTKVN